MGITLREIVYEIGGGIPGAKKFKAVQTGGPSGGFLPESMLDIPVDFDRLEEAGSMMGSGGMIVMDEDTCMVDAARYYVDFLAHESCGKCIPCREGLRQMLAILDGITSGKGREGGRAAPRPVDRALRLRRPGAVGCTALPGRPPAASPRRPTQAETASGAGRLFEEWPEDVPCR